MAIETVKVVNAAAKNGFMLINKCDFDESKHKLYAEKKPRQAKAKEEQQKEE